MDTPNTTTSNGLKRISLQIRDICVMMTNTKTFKDECEPIISLTFHGLNNVQR